MDDVDRVLAAAQKVITNRRYHPDHLGGCIGPLSGMECACGLTDLAWAVQALNQPRCSECGAPATITITTTPLDGSGASERHLCEEHTPTCRPEEFFGHTARPGA